MSRLPGLGSVGTILAVVALGVLVVLAAFGLGSRGGPVGASPSPTLVADAATPSIAPTEQPTRGPSPAPSASPSTEIAYTNPNGIPTTGFAGDDYPFLIEAQELPTYGIIWMDPNQRDFHLGLTGDIEGAIEALKDGIPRGITVYFYIVEQTQAEVCAIRDQIMNDREELRALGIVLSGGGCGNKEMTVSLYVSPLLPEVTNYLQSRYGGPLSFEGGGGMPLRSVEPPTVDEVRLNAVTPDADGQLLTCSGRPFGADYEAKAVGAESGVGPEYAALRESISLYTEFVPELPSVTWRLVEKDTYGATFLGARGDAWLEAPVFASADEWVPGVMNACTPEAIQLGDGGAQWWLDPDYPAPDSASTELHVLVMETACSGGSSPEGRILPPVVTSQDGELHLAMTVRGTGGFATCPGNPSFPVTVVLPEPLGDRTLTGDSSPF